jgi:2-oxoglutarate ferredoxin oxidoreductase subunit delta
VSGPILTRGTVTVDEERCKGCELCIAACRPGVLVMSEATNEVGYRFPLLLEGCTACRACHAVCPDFVFEVYKYDTPVDRADEERAGERSGEPSADREAP